MIGIQGKVVAITGASSGIGRATALMLAERGAKLILGARREPLLQQLQTEILEKGGEALICITDVSKKADLVRLIDLAKSHFGRLDVLFSNAGIGPISALDDLEVTDWEAMIDVNIKGYLYGIAAALPVFRQQEFGHFVTTISTAGLKIVPTMAVYAATKNAVRTINEALRQEAGPNLRVSGISPGLVQTNFADSMTDPLAKAQTIAAMETLGISPEAVARAICFVIEQPADVDVGDIVVRPTAQA
ncbi:MAG: SDR family oxidoreductase [OCS116 cluster bacterium]|uniref:Oxidoreductase n=1 Tax=OCS116 cluster bacterium TaxID=2030921 RepID=A0A2A4Z7G3_9PROT|nr:SDR family oxidoreductase [OCS116 cluster bacterium]